jgi:hypothetical protein
MKSFRERKWFTGLDSSKLSFRKDLMSPRYLKSNISLRLTLISPDYLKS